ncbi:L,D-transpeptidase [Tranquillimonas alkanivorans]|uniref:Lipoprotein-anchoring transpeptidase ErfK/SrfK n=1 Tax=Tranquillimonas alkanivorans TaxID=441119 RepID=A0A1I5LDC9_9RHOB|nr:L,D-transpeptidase [Tranquillimonas alkanivorans]SFO95369.1 Lipoprotein-anchoring transpeptidase ErfK/SrfK [Tranquillimonas alkanivorans]
MFSRRHVLLSAAAGALAAPSLARANVAKPHSSLEEMRPRYVRVRRDAQVGSIHVFPNLFHLYLITAPGEAIEYHVAVGEEGRNFTGRATIERKEEWPSWTPTQNMIRREPEVYARYADGVPGGPDNPLGARALYLYRNGRDTYYRIHGTPQPWTIGRAVSSGCVRLTNQDIIDLYERVPLGAPVRVYPA